MNQVALKDKNGGSPQKSKRSIISKRSGKVNRDTMRNSQLPNSNRQRSMSSCSNKDLEMFSHQHIIPLPNPIMTGGFPFAVSSTPSPMLSSNYKIKNNADLQVYRDDEN
jgi:hypothetical protein